MPAVLSSSSVCLLVMACLQPLNLQVVQPLLRPSRPIPALVLQLGIQENLVRYSCGIESIDDIWADFEQAFAKCSG